MAKAPAKAEPKVKTIPMKCGEKTADVHPDEVDNMKSHGWEKA